MAETAQQAAEATDTREVIAEIATRLFADQGYAAVSIREIASAAKVNIPTIYHYYGGKRALYMACCETVFAAANETLMAALSEKNSPRANVLNFIETLYEMLARDTALSRLYLRELADRDDAGLQVLSNQSFVSNYTALFDLLAELLDEPPDQADVAAIFALTFGLSQIRVARDAALAPGSISRIKGAERVSQYVLSKTFPALP